MNLKTFIVLIIIEKLGVKNINSKTSWQSLHLNYCPVELVPFYTLMVEKYYRFFNGSLCFTSWGELLDYLLLHLFQFWTRLSAYFIDLFKPMLQPWFKFITAALKLYLPSPELPRHFLPLLLNFIFQWSINPKATHIKSLYLLLSLGTHSMFSPHYSSLLQCFCFPFISVICHPLTVWRSAHRIDITLPTHPHVEQRYRQASTIQ